MRYYQLILATVALTGCQSSRMIDLNPADQFSISEINQRAANQAASVTLVTRAAPFDNIRGLHISGDSLLYSSEYPELARADPITDVRQIEFPSRNRLGMGAAIGGLAGGLLLGIVAASNNSSDACDSSTEFCIDVFDWSKTDAFGVGFVLGGLGGALVGALIGASTGTPGVVYRFHTGTPKQLSVVIGVGPQTALPPTSYTRR